MKNAFARPQATIQPSEVVENVLKQTLGRFDVAGKQFQAYFGDFSNKYSMGPQNKNFAEYWRPAGDQNRALHIPNMCISGLPVASTTQLEVEGCRRSRTGELEALNRKKWQFLHIRFLWFRKHFRAFLVGQSRKQFFDSCARKNTFRGTFCTPSLQS